MLLDLHELDLDSLEADEQRTRLNSKWSDLDSREREIILALAAGLVAIKQPPDRAMAMAGFKLALFAGQAEWTLVDGTPIDLREIAADLVLWSYALNRANALRDDARAVCQRRTAERDRAQDALRRHMLDGINTIARLTKQRNDARAKAYGATRLLGEWATVDPQGDLGSRTITFLNGDLPTEQRPPMAVELRDALGLSAESHSTWVELLDEVKTAVARAQTAEARVAELELELAECEQAEFIADCMNLCSCEPEVLRPCAGVNAGGFCDRAQVSDPAGCDSDYALDDDEDVPF